MPPEESSPKTDDGEAEPEPSVEITVAGAGDVGNGTGLLRDDVEEVSIGTSCVQSVNSFF